MTLVLSTLDKRLSQVYSTPEEIIPHLPGALRIAKLYQFDDFYPTLCQAMRTCDTFLRFALAAVAKDEVRAKQLSSATLSLDFDSMSEVVVEVLRHSAPSYYRRLIQLHDTWKTAYSELHAAFATELQVNINLTGYGSQCKKRFGRGCSGYIQTEGKFMALRKIIATATVKALIQTRATSMTRAVEDAIYEAAGCQTCANRHINAFGAQLRQADLERLPKSI